MRYLVFLLSSVVWGANLTFVGTPLKIVHASGIDVPVYAHVATDKMKLNLTGHGIREKTILIASVNVYYAASYMDQKQLEKSKTRALVLTFLRDLNSDKIRSSFTDALKENEVDVETEAMQKLFAMMAFDVKKGSQVRFIGTLGDASDTLLIELPGQTIKTEGPKLAENFWKIWFGKPADSGLKDLKELLSADLKKAP